ncbi:hypothetical protein L596_002258 [Steinernema carpocapsae]|uniref:Uncharacterized protein n=2 Tax=Steinernema carpocapsae TaxID=34508 RepID=A0A4U8UNR6_STECR|nr:hypothetical protein L596_002258 [Steinernema carpocapsae]
MRSMSLELPRSRSAVSLRHSFHDDTCAAPNDPWFDRYYFDLVKRMPYYKSDFYGIHNWTGPFDYWLDYYPYHRSSYSSYVSPYRQYCLNPVSDTFSRGLYMLRAGRIGFNTLDRYWLSPGYWNRRHTDFRQTHRYEMGKNKTPSYFDKTAKQYFTYWI